MAEIVERDLRHEGIYFPSPEFAASLTGDEDGMFDTDGFTESDVVGLFEFLADYPLVTALPDLDPGPSVRLIASSAPVGAATATVWRLVDGVAYDVPGMTRILASAGFIRYDYYAPLGVDVTYRVDYFNAGGNLIESYTNEYPVLLQISSVPGDERDAWLSSPINPNLAVRVEMAERAGSVLTEQFAGKVHQIGDRRILITSGGTGFDDLDMSFYTATPEAYALAVRILQDAKGLIVMRTQPPMAVPRVLYCWSPKPQRLEFSLPAGIPDFEFVNVVTEVSPPTGQYVAGVITYARYMAAFATYREFSEAYPTYREAMLNPPPAVP